ncbi:hypothetical protein GCM10023317_67400 [Actinopolymorpha pittospori]|uniref:Uncharacterized protein n=1 Tax=Actinopolymorpha pittospori TaxID=648752 RepID=A0A927NBY8_9ACTN|nr:hypothetical protein [Actinopolymorpha pittospori]
MRAHAPFVVMPATVRTRWFAGMGHFRDGLLGHFVLVRDLTGPRPVGVEVARWSSRSLFTRTDVSGTYPFR